MEVGGRKADRTKTLLPYTETFSCEIESNT